MTETISKSKNNYLDISTGIPQSILSNHEPTNTQFRLTVTLLRLEGEDRYQNQPGKRDCFAITYSAFHIMLVGAGTNDFF